MRALALIPARGGSERVPGKNLEKVGGRSLLGRAFDCTISTHRTVVVSADPAILDEAEAMLGHRTPGSVSLCFEGNLSPRKRMEDVIAEALEWERAHGRTDHECVVLLQPTSPFRNHYHVMAALQLLRSSGADSVVSGRLGKDVTFFGALIEEPSADGSLPTPPPRPFSQDVHAGFRENGAIYAFTMEHWKRTGQRRGGRCLPFPMTERESIDIDTPEDLAFARVIAGDADDWKRRAMDAERALRGVRRAAAAVETWVDPGDDEDE